MSANKIRTRYQRMSLAMRIADKMREDKSLKPEHKRLATAIYFVLGAPLQTANICLENTPELHDLVEEISRETARI